MKPEDFNFEEYSRLFDILHDGGCIKERSVEAVHAYRDALYVFMLSERTIKGAPAWEKEIAIKNTYGYPDDYIMHFMDCDVAYTSFLFYNG